jgi:hypothetical protein
MVRELGGEDVGEHADDSDGVFGYDKRITGLAQNAAPVTALASRDRADVPPAKRRARRRSELSEACAMPVESLKVTKECASINPLRTPIATESN